MSCFAGFAEKLAWSNHENTHTNAKPYKCGICGWGFNAKGCLESHEIKKHGRKSKMNRGEPSGPLPPQQPPLRDEPWRLDA